VSSCISVPVATVWTSPDAPRTQDAAAVADLPDVAAWTAALAGSDRRGLHGRTLTQALLGEPVEIVDEVGDWCQVRLPWQPHGAHGDGYPGWIRRAHVDSAPSPAIGDEVVAVSQPSALCVPEHGDAVVLSYGTTLATLGTDGDSTLVRGPGGRPARIATTATRRPADGGGPGELLASARQFIGLRYLWGGTCGWGLDCSGLVHLVHRVHGVRIPRDASDQHEQAAVVPGTAAAVPGGLYFFARPGQRAFHVGFMTVDRHRTAMLHAPESGPGDGGRIEEAPLAPDRAETLVGAGTFLPS
jgi:cell wall-associated NlpC family hydrolase